MLSVNEGALFALFPRLVNSAHHGFAALWRRTCLVVRLACCSPTVLAKCSQHVELKLSAFLQRKECE